MSGLVLGIDAGNTKTIALIADAGGTVLGAGRAGSCNIYVSEKDSLSAIQQAAQQAMISAGLNNLQLQAVVLSAAGADWTEDFTLLDAALSGWGWAERFQTVNDAVGALRAGSLAGLGVAVVCGTSAGTAARNADGRVWHSSYWQEPEGAEDLARQALRAVYRAELGIDAPTSLTKRVLAEFGCPDTAALLHLLTARNQPPQPHLGHLARLLLDEAAAGDPASLRIAAQHGAALGDYALAAARQVGLDHDYLLVTSGGVMRHPLPVLREALLARVREQHGGVTWRASHHEPVFGALLLAHELAGASVTQALFKRLEATCPDAALFLT